MILSSCKPQKHVKTTPLFWEITSSTNKIYILGSIHVATPEIYPLSQTIMEAYEESSCVVLERDITSERIGKSLGHNSLSQFMDSKLYEQAVNTILEMNPSLTMDDIQSNSFYGIMELLMQTCYEKTGLSPEYGVDNFFAYKAIEDKKSVSGVESYAQAAQDEKLFPSEYYEYTLKNLLNVDSYSNSVMESFELWCMGDESALERTQVQPLRGTAKNTVLGQFLYEFMIKERNSRIAQKAIDCLEDGQTTFVVVGVAHLIGEESVIFQLGELGYNVEQLEIK